MTASYPNLSVDPPTPDQKSRLSLSPDSMGSASGGEEGYPKTRVGACDYELVHL